MTDLLIDPVTHDLVIEEGFLSYTTDLELIRQRLEITLKTYRGEWFPNALYGVPYLENEDNKVQLLGKGTTPLLELTIKRTILESPNIVSLTSFSLQQDPLLRKVDITFTALTDDGSQVTQTLSL